MSFWGVEVKAGKPYTLDHNIADGRLRLTQATLGNGEASKRTMVQCNVGEKSPIILCSLLPNVAESCNLELEFEEEDDVVFSVIGPRSVHLSGYFRGHSGGRCDNGDSDSSGEDIAETETEESDSYYSENDYEKDFINDDGMEVFPPSPRPNSGVVIEEIVDDEKQAISANAKRSKKKNQRANSDKDNANSDRQIVIKTNHSPVSESEDEDGFPTSLSIRNKSETGITEGKEQPELSDKIPDEAKLSDKTPEVVEVGKSSKLKKKIKDKIKKVKSSEPLGSLSVDAGKGETGSEKNLPAASGGGETQGVTILNKKNKKKRTNDDVSPDNDEVNNEKLEKDRLNNDQSEVDSNIIVIEPKKKRKKGKSKTTDSTTKDSDVALTDGPDELVSKTCGLDGNAQVSKTRTFPNGLTIEELSMGKPDGKRATPGKKVSVHYIGKLQNGKIFDSNIGQRPFCFRLGVGSVIKGWDVGVNGMRVGDKRRLTIPPSMGYGSKGAGKIPGNAWLVFDVELDDVRG